jgi:hypothetical protein
MELESRIGPLRRSLIMAASRDVFTIARDIYKTCEPSSHPSSYAAALTACLPNFFAHAGYGLD